VNTPKLLNRWQLIGVTAMLLFGVASALVQFISWQADGRAADDTEQLVRVQEIQSNLLRADALATNQFLRGGLEDTDRREEYDNAIDAVFSEIADAAEAQPADKEVLADLNVRVNDYASHVAQARDYNRQQIPVGSEYLATASNELRSDALPILDALVEANTERADDAMGGQHPYLLLVVGVAALAVLWWLNREIARRFKRRINRGLAVAALIVLVATVVTVALAFGRAGSNDELRVGAFRDAVDNAATRTAVNDAKANESLRLIKWGSGQIYEDRWAESAALVDDMAPSNVRGAWEEYRRVHDEIVTLDEGNDRDAAVELATSDSDGASTTLIDGIDGDLQDLVDESAETATDELRSGRVFALILSMLTLVLGFVAAFAVARGIGERRREYA
jgi:hypothetical protein